MVSPVPKRPFLRSGTYDAESSSFFDFGVLAKYFQPRTMKISKNSPPVLNKDVFEGEEIWDRTLNRKYTVSNGVLRYVQYT